MATDTCMNCGNPDTETYDLLVRNDDHSEVPLCGECHDALGEEFIWSA